ncbi:unnamed protein product [Spirodela intermedia]|uniref:Retroviral polymerase SH3-like domain-containing protein n=1 Tax=Spirodela intermedia TaxID=51605 RepID=A0A7I8LIH4_SPIIN|nr:unnamed protein product [Spirodela intermedia]
MNWTIFEKVQCFLSNTTLLKSFWLEATPIVAYLIKKSLPIAIEKKTPQEIWSSSLANYYFLKVLGCLTYVCVNNGKFEPRLVKYIFLRFKPRVNGYKLYHPKNQKSYLQ